MTGWQFSYKYYKTHLRSLCLSSLFVIRQPVIFNRYSLVLPQALHLAKKVQLWLIWTHYKLSSVQAFQWASDEQPTLPLSPPKGAGKRKLAIFHLKMHLSRRKSAAKFICVKTGSGTVVRRSLVCLSVQKWLVGMSPSTWNFRPKWPTPFWNGNCQAIFARTVSVVKTSEKSSLSLIGSQHELSNEPKVNILRCL